jgi:Shikimate kinase
MKNIVLIGMPGCGKTSIAYKLEKELNLSMIDLDQFLVEYFNESIAEMFEKSEDYFREKESFICQYLKNQDGKILATGGGVIKRKENITALKENGIIFFIDRSIENIISDIDTSTRPLLKTGKEKLHSLYEERYSTYLSSCDIKINNNQTLNETVKQIIHFYEHDKII